MIERANHALEKALKCMIRGNTSLWDLQLGRATRSVNSRVVVALGYTPVELLFGVQPRLPFETFYPDEPTSELWSWAAQRSSTAAEPRFGIQRAEWENHLLSRNVELQGMRDVKNHNSDEG